MDLKELYRDVILDHNRRPRNFGRLESAGEGGELRRAEGHNPLCGDKLAVFVVLDGERVRDIRFEGSGCAISTASASLMTEAVKGRDRAAVATLFDKVHTLLTQHDAPADPTLGKLAALGGVSEFPARVKCAALSWHTLNAALEHGAGTVSTE
ncbi:MAG TPA: SUF system NifU family Fe-S cluster assembly protein [Steroidobacteraceae bacterium]|jgi:nitrogen fixation NifU-like protein|nr:SUF system NifU family Fe-S cluster assembly protein [Steroidobacteraceae bacterium]